MILSVRWQDDKDDGYLELQSMSDKSEKGLDQANEEANSQLESDGRSVTEEAERLSADEGVLSEEANIETLEKCVCECVCICVYMCMCVYIYIYVCVCVSVCVCMYIYTKLFTSPK